MCNTTKQFYSTPRVLREAELHTESAILDGSMVVSINPVETAGQETGGFYDNSETFNFSWED